MDAADPIQLRQPLRAVALLFLLGATLGAGLDGIHTHFGATAYTSPLIWQMAWWTPLLFGGAFAIGMLRPILDRRFGRRSPRPTLPSVLLGMGLFIVAYASSVLPLPWPLTAALLTAFFAVGWLLCDRSPIGLAIALVAAVGGPAVEMFLISRGTFMHLHPVLYTVSGWLPCLYLCAAVGLTTLARWLVAE